MFRKIILNRVFFVVGGGVIQGTASEATLVALLGAKAKAINAVKKEHPEMKDSDIIDKLVGYTSSKLSYLKFVGTLKKAIAQFKPDVVHAHYATSYGLIGALTGFHPLTCI